jgi:succinyldiaminopimelate transaminase
MRVNPALDQTGSHPIAAIHQRVRDLQAAGERVLDFSIGDPVEPTWEAIPEAVRAAVPAVSQYPTTLGLPALRRSIAAYLERRFGVAVDPDRQVIPTSGAKEAIFSTPLAFVDRARGDAVGYPDPGYPVYARGATRAGAEAVAVAADDSFLTTAGSVPEELWPRLVMLWICTPSNPTGAVLGASDLARLIERCRAHDVLLCSDECYVDLYEEGAEPPTSVLQAAGEGSSGVLSFLSLSKRSGMTGYRAGAVVGDPEAIERIYRLRTSTGTASPEFVQQGAVTAWSDDRHAADRRRIFSAKRKLLREGLEVMGLEVAASQAGLYLWIRVEDDLAVTAALAEAGVVVTPGRIFGSRGLGYLRLALVPGLETCREALIRMKPILT